METKNTETENSKSNHITPRDQDYSKWYLDVIAAADLSDNSPVRGCMVIKPNGYALWENIQKILNQEFKLKGVHNAYFPLLIPMSFFEKEAEHVEGFAKECAVVTHTRLSAGSDGKLEPAGKLDEPLILRPTSETIIYTMYAQWINTFKDLPVVMNQWANVIRMEMRTRAFLRTTEFLWQEGHTAHASEKEADEMTLSMLETYQKFVEEYLAIPVIIGKKTESEKFAGANYTTTVETMMQDGKALQGATSHMLGQNFAKPFNVKFADQDGNMQYVWQTSWGISTRIIGAMVMAHGDDKGIIVPPKIAAMPVVIVPIWGSDEEMSDSIAKAKEIANSLSKETGFDIHVDERNDRPGPKFYDWERKGVPLRLEIGPRDIAKGVVVAVRRDTGEKEEVELVNLSSKVTQLLSDIQTNLFSRALKYKESKTFDAETYDELKKIFDGKGTGFVNAYWCGDTECEAKVKEETTATIRCVPFSQDEKEGDCIVCGKKTQQKVIFAKAY